MQPIPRAALLLGLAGLLPFVWSLATQISAPLADIGLSTLGPRYVGPFVGLQYGTIILAFMAGVLWGFATKAQTAANICYALSVIPALWAFFLVGDGPTSSAIFLAIGFIGLLGLDFVYWQYGLTPPWWMRLRMLLTGGVVTCLTLTALI